MSDAPITVTMPQILTRKLRERFKDDPHNIELYIFDAVDYALRRDRAAELGVPPWQLEDPDEPPLTPEEEAALDSGREAILRGDFSDYLSLDELGDFSAEED